MIDTELVVLACIFKDEKFTKVRLKDIPLKYFSDSDRAKLVIDYRQENQPFDMVLGKERFGDVFLAELTSALECSNLELYDFYLARLKVKYCMNKLNSDGINIEIVNQLAEAVKVKAEKERLYDFNVNLHSYTEEVEKRATPESIKLTVGDTSFDSFTKKLNYLKPGQSIAVGARTGIGKTQLMVNFMSHFMQQNIACLYITAEVSYSEICDRLVAINTANGSTLNQWKIGNGEFTSAEWLEFNTVIQNTLYDKKSIIYEVSSFNIPKINELIERYNPQVVFVDFIQRFRLAGGKSDTRASILSDIANELKTIAMEKKVVMVIASQLNRGANDKEPDSSDFKESGGIEEAADKCLLIYGEVRTELGRSVKIKISKNRSGYKGDVFDFCFNNRTGKLNFIGEVESGGMK